MGTVVRRAREELRQRRTADDRQQAAREPFEMAWDRERAPSDVERVAGRIAWGLIVGVLLGSWLDLSLSSLLALVVGATVVWAALGWFVDWLQGEPPAT